MRNIKIIVEYDGTNHAGWQRQKSHSTIQQQLEDAICAITGVSKVVVHGSGRTDAGVHAVGQVANFHTESSIATESFPPAINAHLPDDIAVIAAEEVEMTFHARKSARSKRYRYSILRRRYPSPTERLYAFSVRDEIDVEAMRRAAAHLIGEHDFSAFESKSEEDSNSVRTVTSLVIKEDGDRLDLEVRANGFLYNMVRAIVGTLLEVGRGKRAAEEVKDILQSSDRARAGATAPAKGLRLVEVNY
jgi:tRNA pseudouridine38-40 synthase